MTNHLDTFDEKDCEVLIWPPRKVGGQHCRIPNGIKLIHKPTGAEAISTYERSQHKNRENATFLLMLKLEELDNKSKTND